MRLVPFPGAELGDALPYEKFQVLRRKKRSVYHHTDDIMVPFRKTTVSTVIADRSRREPE